MNNTVFTTKQLADAIGVSLQTIRERARITLGKQFENGKPTYFTREEILVIIDAITRNPSNNLTEEQKTKINNLKVQLTGTCKLNLQVPVSSQNNLKVELKGGSNNPLHKNFFPKDAEELDLAVELSTYIDAVTAYIQAKRKLNAVRSELKLIE